MLKDKLAIFLITYNRRKKLRSTLDSLLKSPVSDFDITVLDNASTDGSSEMLEEYAKKHENIKHVRHKINIGGNANICRAFEMAATSGKEYVWVLCDDDKYDFSNWGAVEKAIKDNADIVCLADYVYPDEKAKLDFAYQLFQLTFVPAGIYKTSLITDTVLINMYDSIYTMFSQSCITMNAINNGAKIVVLNKPVVFNGLHFEDRETDVAYTRGQKTSDILERRRNTVWTLGFCNVISLLKDKQQQQYCMEVVIPYKDIHASWDAFYTWLANKYENFEGFNYFLEIYKALPENRQKDFMTKYPFNLRYKNVSIKWYKKLFSVDKTRHHRFIRFFGIKINIGNLEVKK